MQRSLSMGRNGIPLCFTMFSIRLLYPTIARIEYDVKDLKYKRPQPYRMHAPNSKQTAKTTYDAAKRPFLK